LSDERTLLCIHVIVGKEDVRQALEKANDTALCFALREVKYALEQRQKAKTTIDHLWRIIKQLYDKQNRPVISWWKKPSTG